MPTMSPLFLDLGSRTAPLSPAAAAAFCDVAGAPHLVQNFTPLSSSFPHFAQYMFVSPLRMCFSFSRGQKESRTSVEVRQILILWHACIPAARIL